MGLIKDR